MLRSSGGWVEIIEESTSTSLSELLQRLASVEIDNELGGLVSGASVREIIGD